MIDYFSALVIINFFPLVVFGFHKRVAINKVSDYLLLLKIKDGLRCENEFLL